MRSRLGIAIVAAIGVIGCTEVALGQRGVNSIISRPTERAPSATIAGKFTRRSVPTMQSTGRQVATIGESQYQFQPGRRSVGRGAVLPSVQFGLQTPVMRSGGETMISGFQSPTRWMRSVAGLGTYGRPLPTLDAHLFTPQSKMSEFQAYFGLSAPEPTDQARPKPLPERMSDRLDIEVQRARDQALSLFRDATVEARELDPATGISQYPNCRDCMENLARAVNRLLLVRDLDKEDHVAPLLLVHALLEQERPLAAASQLVRTWARNPTILNEDAEIDRYFGDVGGEEGHSEYLAAQMQRYVRLGEFNPGAPEASAVEAYCAWRLGDLARARAAAERAYALELEAEEKDIALLQFAEAMSAIR
jgi:hypothetical protein